MKAADCSHAMSTGASRLAHSSFLHRDQHSDVQDGQATQQQLQQQQQHHNQQHHHNQQQQQQQRHNQQQQQRRGTTPAQQFREEYYRKGDISQLDTVFYAIHLVMSAVHKRVLVTSREQLGFEVAIAIFAAALLTRVFYKPAYTRVRPQLVFIIHVLLTIIRACVVCTMDSKQAVHFRKGMIAEDTHTASIFATTMLAILGGPFRLFEMMGLQQAWRAHVLVTLLYLAVHPMMAAEGIRLACSNAMFYQVHAVHDAVSAVVDGLVYSVSGIPTGQQETCSSCAGVAVYGFLCLFASVAVPLYVMYVWEQTALQRWLQQPAGAAGGAAATAAAAAPTESAAANGDTPAADGSSVAAAGAQPALQQAGLQAAGSRAGGAADLRDTPTGRQHGVLGVPGGSIHSSAVSGDGTAVQLRVVAASSSSSVRADRRITRLEAICLKAEAVAAEHGAMHAQLPTLSGLVTSSSLLTRWGTHAVVLLVLMVTCWLAANCFALVVLPRVLSSQQLQRWCPNSPYVPYVIAGEVYEGL